MSLVIGNKIRIVLKNNFHYDGIINELDDKNLILTDRFGKTVTVARDSIMLLEEVR